MTALEWEKPQAQTCSKKETSFVGRQEPLEVQDADSSKHVMAPNQITSSREWIRLGLLFGSPLFCAASNIGLALLAFSLSPMSLNNSAASVVFLLNLTFAITGCGAGGFLSGDTLTERVVLMFFAACGGALFYLAFNCFGFTAVLAIAVAYDSR